MDISNYVYIYLWCVSNILFFPALNYASSSISYLFLKKLLGKNNPISTEMGMGAYPSMENSMKIINILFEPFPYKQCTH